MPSDPDRDLVLQCQAVGSEGFEAAFGQLYRIYKDRVYSLAYRITGDSNEALDAAQEAFVLLYQNITSFQFDSKFSSWLYRLVVNASIDHLRRTKSRRRRHELVLDRPESEANLVPDESTAGPVEVAARHELGDQVRDGILQLSPKLRVITVLRYQQNLSYEDLAETLQISLGTVKSRLARAHLALAEILRPIVGPAPERQDAARADGTSGDAAQGPSRAGNRDGRRPEGPAAPRAAARATLGESAPRAAIGGERGAR